MVEGLAAKTKQNSSAVNVFVWLCDCGVCSIYKSLNYSPEIQFILNFSNELRHVCVSLVHFCANVCVCVCVGVYVPVHNIFILYLYKYIYKMQSANSYADEKKN